MCTALAVMWLRSGKHSVCVRVCVWADASVFGGVVDRRKSLLLSSTAEIAEAQFLHRREI